MSNYSSLFRVLSPSRVQTKFEEKSLPARYTDIMIFCLVQGDAIKNSFPIDTRNYATFGHLRIAIKDAKQNAFVGIDADRLTLWRVDIIQTKENQEVIVKEHKGVELHSFESVGSYFQETPTSTNIRIIVEPPPPATTGTTGESLSIPMKRQAEPQVYNREPVPPHERDFWNELPKAQIVLKLPDNANNVKYMSEPLSKYMKVEGNKIVLGNNVMLNSQNELIFCDYVPVVESGERIKMDFVKFLRLCKSPDGIVYGISTQDILIKKSYLQMIEKIELDRIKGKKGCVIIGSPGIGKTHFSLYLAFYLTRRYNLDDIMYEQSSQKVSRLLHIKSNQAVMKVSDSTLECPIGDSFYIADSVIPALWSTKYTFVVTTPKHGLWHDFVKIHPRKYYAPIWSEEEIWHVWNWNDQYKDKVSDTRVKELIERWGCVPRRVFVEYDDEPDLNYIVSKCNVYKYLKDDGGDLDDDYSGKAIHIVPNADFTNKTYVPASAEICEALYKYYENNTKDTIINVIRSFAGGSGGTLAGIFFEMLAHDVLRKGGKFKIRRLTDDNHKWPEQDLELQGLELNRYDDVQEINSGYYNFPKIKNFESVDAIAPQCNGIHHLYQITTAGKHDTKVNGLSKLENHLGRNLPIHLYFVVPDINHVFDNFRYQNYVTTKDGKYEGWNRTTEWIRDDIEQYVLEIKLNTC